MRNKMGLNVLAVIIAAVVAGSFPLIFAQASGTSSADRWAGTWEGKRDGLPSVVLRITDNGGALQGQADFYILMKVNGKAATANDKMTVPMLNPHVEGNVLGFQVAREERGDKAKSAKLLSLTLEPNGDRTAKLKRLAGDEEAIEVDMARVSE